VIEGRAADADELAAIWEASNGSALNFGERSQRLFQGAGPAIDERIS
jgi:hypothetical protein